jgi:hypothetical protein
MKGSSPILLRRALGNEIDAHDIVVRINNAPLGVPSYEITGRRSSFRVLNEVSYSDPMDEEEGIILHQYLYQQFIDKNYTTKPLEVRAKIFIIHKNIIVNQTAHFIKLWEIFSGKNLSDPKAPKWATSGFLTLLLLMPKCDFIDLYGFNPYPKKTTLNSNGVPINYGHYWETTARTWFDHDISVESFLFYAFSIVYSDIVSIRN